MRLQLASDLHLEFNESCEFEEILIPSAPTLLLAGDVGDPTKSRYSEFLVWCSCNYKDVVVIAGNHEYYSNYSDTMRKRKAIIRRVCAYLPNVHFLDNGSKVLSDDLVIIGTTLWSCILPEERFAVSTSINDFNKIYMDYPKRFTVEDYDKLHRESYWWLKTEIETYPDKIVIVLTHHLPSLTLIDEKFKGCPYNSAFASSVEDLCFKDNVKFWFFGHSHASSDSVMGDCRLVSNPYGYSERENPKYRKDLVIEVGEEKDSLDTEIDEL